MSYRGLRTVVIDGTTLHVPDSPQIVQRYPKHSGDQHEFGYSLVRLLVLAECSTHALLIATFGPDNEGERRPASRLLTTLIATMLLLAAQWSRAAMFAWS